jgi:hypothetical protein
VKTLKEVLKEAREEYEKLPQHVKDIMERNSQLRKMADEIEYGYRESALVLDRRIRSM